MKKKIFSAVVCLFLAGLVAGCGGKYSDLIEVNQQYADLMKSYIESMDKVDNAAAAAVAVNKLADGMEKLAPKMRDLGEKYLELEKPEKLSKELQESADSVAEVSQKFAESFMKLMPYMSDKKVQEAQKRLSSVMSSMGQRR